MENKERKINTICIIGAGEMGHGIAEVFAIGNIHVNLYDIAEDILHKALIKIKISLEKLIKKRKIRKQTLDEILQRITTTTSLEDALTTQGSEALIDMVIEAVPEIPKLKKQIFEEIERIELNFMKKGQDKSKLNEFNTKIKNKIILATNTSTILIKELSQDLQFPERFMGVHFFNPPVIMKSVELIYLPEQKSHNAENSEYSQNLNIVFDILKNLKMKPVYVKDSPGFAVNRVLSAGVILVLKLVEKELMSPEEIDVIVKQKGVAMGPFETMDFVGLDITYHVQKYLAEKIHPEYDTPAWFNKLVENKKLGLKTGEGIYKWQNGKIYNSIITRPDSVRIDSNKAKLFSVFDTIAVQINEATKLFEEGIVENWKDIDTLIKYGTAISLSFYNILKTMKDQIIERCNFFQELLGIELFKPTEYLKNFSSS
ncbi:MAG: 3-hydroxyacyl-CoA dehydrogenase family protein [Promethearchaeota archaeon]